jgi:hypothetical protein
MLNGAAQESGGFNQSSSGFTAEDIHRQQRVNLMMRVLDLECENALLQQEVQQLKSRLANPPSMDIEHRAPLE